MFYLINNGIEKYDTLPPKRCGIIAGLVCVEELESLSPMLEIPQASVTQCRQAAHYFRSSVEVYDKFSFATVKRTVGEEGADCIAVFLMRDLFLVVDIKDSDGSTRQKFNTSLHRFPPTAMTLEKLVFAFLDALTEGDARMLEDLEFELARPIEALLCDHESEDLITFLLEQKKRLLLLRNYYEQLIDIGHALEENENDLFGEGDLRFFKIFTDKAERLERNVRTLREQLTELREAHQSTLERRQNDTMRILTVLSAIFLPLSFITGWYGMNFHAMPELSWQYGYPFAALLCVFVTIVLIFIFRHKSWL